MKNLIGKGSSLNFSGFLTNTNVKAQKAMIPKYPCLNQSTEMFSKMNTKLPKWPLRQLVLLLRDKAPTTITNNSNIYFLLEALWIFAGSRRCSFYWQSSNHKTWQSLLFGQLFLIAGICEIVINWFMFRIKTHEVKTSWLSF